MRKPTPARVTTALPSLTVALAGVAAAQGCAHVECGESRADEVVAHGQRGVDHARRGALNSGLREVAIAAGLAAHDATQPSVGVENAPRPGSLMLVSPEAVPLAADGGVAEVSPVPPEPPRPIRTAGVPVRVTPRRELLRVR